MLDLYGRRFKGERLRPDEYVISADEKSQLQALGRRHQTLPPAPGRSSLVEFDRPTQALTPNDFGSLDG